MHMDKYYGRSVSNSKIHMEFLLHILSDSDMTSLEHVWKKCEDFTTTVLTTQKEKLIMMKLLDDNKRVLLRYQTLSKLAYSVLYKPKDAKVKPRILQD